MQSDPDITIEWDHAAGAIEVRMPSGTRIAFKKDSGALVYGMLNALHLLPRERKFNPLTQAEIDKMVKKFFKDGHCVIAALNDPPKGSKVSLEDIGL